MHRLDLFGGELVAIDGSKFRALNSRKRNFNRERLFRLIKQIDEKVAAYLAEVERQDATEPTVVKPTASELHAKIKQLEERQQRYHDLTTELHKSGATEISSTDPDSRLMVVGQ